MQFKVDRPQTTVVAKNLSVLQLFISRMPKMCAILQLVSAPLNPIPIAEHFRRSHPQCEHSCDLNVVPMQLISFHENNYQKVTDLPKKQMLSILLTCNKTSLTLSKSFGRGNLPCSRLSDIWCGLRAEHDPKFYEQREKNCTETGGPKSH